MASRLRIARLPQRGGRAQHDDGERPGSGITYLELDAPAILTLFHDAVYLNFEDAKRLQKELYTLAQSYFGKGGDARYLVRVNLVPVPEDSEYIP